MRSPLYVARCGACSNRRSQATVRSQFSNHFLVVPSCDVTSAKPTTESDFASVSGQAQIRPCTTRSNHHAATAVRLSEVDASGDALSAPITVNNNGIDARNEQAYHGRKTTTTNGTRPAVSRSCSREGQRKQRQRRGRIASRVRSRPGAAGRTRVLRVGTEAAASIDSMR